MSHIHNIRLRCCSNGKLKLYGNFSRFEANYNCKMTGKINDLSFLTNVKSLCNRIIPVATGRLTWWKFFRMFCTLCGMLVQILCAKMNTLITFTWGNPMLHSQGFMAHFQVVNNKQFSWRSDHLLKSCGSLLTDSLSSVFILEKTPRKRRSSRSPVPSWTREKIGLRRVTIFSHMSKMVLPLAIANS